MIENYLLAELVAFGEHGTLAQTAAALHVTQPTVTRGMQKLEDDLGVTLFDRQPNRITLTATGKLAVTRAAAVLRANQAFVEQVQAFDRSHHVFRVVTTLPGPKLVVHHAQTTLPANLELDEALLADGQVVAQLRNAAATLVLSDHELLTDDVESRYLGTESLAVNLDQFMYQANQPSVTFAELKGLSFLVLQDIGAWRAIIQREIPDAHFLYQAQRQAFTEITQYSDFPYFSTNLSAYDSQVPAMPREDNRVRRPISDASAHLPIYGSYLKAQRHRVTPVLRALTAAWPAE